MTTTSGRAAHRLPSNRSHLVIADRPYVSTSASALNSEEKGPENTGMPSAMTPEESPPYAAAEPDVAETQAAAVSAPRRSPVWLRHVLLLFTLSGVAAAVVTWLRLPHM